MQGVNISGGQKQRIQIARAVYAAPDVVLLDDPLSALDSKVGRAVFHKCIQRELKGCTRVLVTSQLQYVFEADHIVVVKGGEVAESGSYEDLMARDGVLAEMLQDVTSDDVEQEPAGALPDAQPLTVSASLLDVLKPFP
jgi:ATP-binding cassette, subfamily C (CFTR/MRP), member 1